MNPRGGMNSFIGPIHVSPNGRCFIDHAGKPFFWLGDTLWELFRLFTEDEAASILEDRREKGFNVILVMLTGVDTTKFSDAVEPPFTDIDGVGPWIGGDPLKPDERYFRRIDHMMTLGGRTGQMLVVGVFHQWHAGTITVTNARKWGRWLGERYRDVPNLIWSMYPKAEENFVPVCNELAAGLREGDGGSHLISVHPDPAVASSSFIHGEEWLSFNMIQTCIEYDRIHDAVRADYDRTPVKPVIMAEGGYEGLEFGKLQTAHDIRKQAFWTWLSGGYFVYGHNDSWRTPRSIESWIDAPGSRDMTVFRRIVTALPSWWDLVPDDSLISEGKGGGFSLNLAARSADGRWVAAYLSEPSEILLDLSILRSGPSSFVWVNPASGERLTAAGTNREVRRKFSTPGGWSDAFLIVDTGEGGSD